MGVRGCGKSLTYAKAISALLENASPARLDMGSIFWPVYWAIEEKTCGAINSLRNRWLPAFSGWMRLKGTLRIPIVRVRRWTPAPPSQFSTFLTAAGEKARFVAATAQHSTAPQVAPQRTAGRNFLSRFADGKSAFIFSTSTCATARQRRRSLRRGASRAPNGQPKVFPAEIGKPSSKACTRLSAADRQALSTDDLRGPSPPRCLGSSPQQSDPRKSAAGRTPAPASQGRARVS